MIDDRCEICVFRKPLGSSGGDTFCAYTLYTGHMRPALVKGKCVAFRRDRKKAQKLETGKAKPENAEKPAATETAPKPVPTDPKPAPAAAKPAAPAEPKRKGRKWTEEQREALSQRMTGREWTEEQKAAQSQRMRGRKLTEEHKAAISQRMRERKWSEEQKAAQSQRMREAAEEARAKGEPWGNTRKPLPENFWKVYRRHMAGEITGAAAARELKMAGSTFRLWRQRIADGEVVDPAADRSDGHGG